MPATEMETSMITYFKHVRNMKIALYQIFSRRRAFVKKDLASTAASLALQRTLQDLTMKT